MEKEMAKKFMEGLGIIMSWIHRFPMFIYLLPIYWHHDANFDMQCTENGSRFLNFVHGNKQNWAVDPVFIKMKIL